MTDFETNCIFCKIIKGEISSYKVYEDAETFVFLDAMPVNEGHVLVVPKKHFLNLYELPDEILSKMSLVVRNLSIQIKKALGADGINIQMNNDEGAGQVIFHAHIHIIPRFVGDGLRHWPGKKFSKEKMEEILGKIKNT